MEQPIVTVWCLTYNQKDFIRDALDGFVMQKTTFPFEVIVHDDASTDGTTDIVLEYARLYPDIIKPMIETENQWQGGGLKHIINIMNEKHRKGRYIAFCEGDDYWIDPQKLQRQVDFLESHPDYSMCFHSAKKKYETNVKAWIDCENIQDKEYDATDIFINWTVPTASVLCRKEGMEFYANLKHLERIQNYDIFIFLSCAMIGKLRGMHEQMSVYRIQGEGLTYNKQALIRCTMNNPGHFMTLKENFPIVDAKPVDDTISKVLFERALIQDSFVDKLADLWQSFRYSSGRFIKMSTKIFFRKSKIYGFLLILSIVNLLFMHYSLFFLCDVERQIDFTIYVDNLSMVTCEVLLIFIVLSLLTKRKMRLAAFLTALFTLLWSFCNVVYARFFFQYISISAIGESGNLLDPFIFKCLVDGTRWSDFYYLGSILISCYLYHRTSDFKFGMREFKYGVLVMMIMLVIDAAAHVAYCVYSPSMRYFSYVKHRLSLELLSQQCYSAQPVYANFQRGSVRALGYGLMEHFSGTMVLTDGQREEIEDELDALKPLQICSKSHPNIDNVIFILVESYMSFTVNMKVKGQEVTPFLNSLYRDSTVYYNGQMNSNITLGESSDGQFIYMTGLLPLRSAITVTKARKYSYSTLPRQLAIARRMHTQMVIPTAPSMWSQDVMCERYGIDRLYSTSDYQKPHSMYLSDDQIVDMADSVNKISKQPFFLLVLTFSMHQPYVNGIDSTFDVSENGYSASLNYYLNACHFTDRQLCRYFDGLKEQGIYDRSLIIITSDHHVGNSALELPDSIADRKLPLFIIHGGEDMKRAWVGECNQLDVYTTIMDIMGVESSWLGLGHSLLSPDYKNSLTDRKWDYSEWMIKSGYFNDKKN